MSTRLPQVLRTFLQIGLTAFGGVWASARQIERTVVDENGWLDSDTMRSTLLISTVVPAPRFLAMASLVGQQVRGMAGSTTAALGLVLPAAIGTVVAAVLVTPELLAGPLAAVADTIGVVVVGLLTGNALFQWRSGRAGLRDRSIGTGLTAVMLTLMIAGVPIVIVALGGFVLGPLMIRR